MKKILSLALCILLILQLLPYAAVASEEDASDEKHVVLTIGDNSTRSGPRYNENLGMWQYLAELVGVEIKYVFLSDEEYAARLASGDLPDIVATSKNLSGILENGVALTYDEFVALNPAPAAAAPAEDPWAAYVNYIHEWLLAEDEVNDQMTSDIVENEFMPLVEAGDFTSFPADMLFNGMLENGAALTYDEFVALNQK